MEVEVVLAALFGLLIGSFLNVCIYRLPRDLSVVRPRSHCPECGAMVRSWDNIPVLSYLLLRGKCRDCGARISPRYAVVELLTGAAFAWFAAQDGASLLSLRNCVFAALMIALAMTDLETRLLPEQLTFPGIAAGLLFAIFQPVGDGTAALVFGLSGRAASVMDALLGAVIPAGALWLAGWIFKLVRKREGLGFGDLVLLAEIGAFLGLRATLLTLVLASVAGSLIGGAYIMLTRKPAESYELPLGTFLGSAGVFVAAFGTPVVRWYSGLLG
jgi:leader peptidase (prepilin peptidase)/N-methyltransferase